MTQSTPQQSTPQHTAAQQPAPYGRPCLLYTSDAAD